MIVDLPLEQLEELALAGAYTLLVGGKKDTDLLRSAVQNLHDQIKEESDSS